MRELSLHILDIAQNSLSAGADNIRIVIIEDYKQDKLIIKIKDNGCGMDEETVKNVVDPFYTTRTTRKVGLGIPMFKQSAESTDGGFKIKSELGVGTEIDAEFKISHIDRMPLGNMAETIITVIMADINVNLVYTHTINENTFTLNTKEIKKTLGDLPIDNLDVIMWLKGYVQDNLNEMRSQL